MVNYEAQIEEERLTRDYCNYTRKLFKEDLTLERCTISIDSCPKSSDKDVTIYDTVNRFYYKVSNVKRVLNWMISNCSESHHRSITLTVTAPCDIVYRADSNCLIMVNA